MKKILVITPFSPDNQGKGVSYTSQLLCELSKTWKIDLIYFKYKRDEFYEPVSPNIKVISVYDIGFLTKLWGAISLPFLFPLFTSRYSGSKSRKINNLIAKNNYSAVYIDFNQLFSYTLTICHPNIVLMAHDVIYQRYKRRKSFFLPWIKFSEKLVMRNSRAIVTFSEKDCEIVKLKYSLDSFSTTFFLNKNVIEAYPIIESDYFVFFGAWSRFDNAEALIWFLDNVYDRLPNIIKFKVIGGGMSDDLKNRLGKLPNFEYLGFVENPYPIIANARAEIAPLHYGAGVKVKCIEALACGTTIIGTNVAFEGISLEYESSMILAETPDDYVREINNLKFSLESRKMAKDTFINTYNNKAIIQFLQNI